MTNADTRPTKAQDRSRCVVLTPAHRYIEPACEQNLQELEKRGYVVRRRFGHSAIDLARNLMATEALKDGFEETIWIDSDIEFDPDDVDRIREHGKPFIAGLYPKKGKREMAVLFGPDTHRVLLGEGGGLLKVKGSGAGFLYVRKEVYQAVKSHHSLPTCQHGERLELIPFFMPLIEELEGKSVYRAEDLAFCIRAAQAGYQLYADTRIRLYHIGNYRYSWENAGQPSAQYRSFRLEVVNKRSPNRVTAQQTVSGIFSKFLKKANS